MKYLQANKDNDPRLYNKLYRMPFFSLEKRMHWKTTKDVFYKLSLRIDRNMYWTLQDQIELILRKL